jgi:hypothetical protein
MDVGVIGNLAAFWYSLELDFGGGIIILTTELGRPRLLYHEIMYEVTSNDRYIDS